MEETSESLHLSEFRDDVRRMIELYARDPNVTRIAETLGVHRTTIYRWLDEEGVQDMIIQLRIKLDEDRNSTIEKAQDDAMELIAQQLALHRKQAQDNPGAISIQDTQRLMQIAEKLAAMKKEASRAARDAIARARRAAADGSVDWGSDPIEDQP